MDLAIRGAVVISDGAYARDILIRDGRVAALVEPGASSADEEIDARGLFAMPGIVDAHVHFNDPGRAEWEGWASGSRAAAAGGVTTVIDMPLNSLPPVLDGASFQLKRAAAERASIVDFALWGGLVGTDPAPLRELAELGAVGVKAFLCDSGVPEFPAVADADLEPAMRAAASAGLLVAVHAEDEEVIRNATAKVRGTGQTDPRAWVASRPAVAEIRAATKACAAARKAGARLHLVHMSSAGVLGAIGLARQAGGDVTVETCAHYLTFDENDVAALGPLLKCAPPIRDAANRDALWEALLGGRIDLVASDHSPCLAQDKAKGRDDIFAAWGGVSGVQSLLPAIFTETLRRATGMDPRKVAGFVAWRLAARPADRFGLASHKGRIKAGADADIVLFDPDREWTLEPEAVRTRSGLTPYAGRRFTGAVVRTMVRGRTVHPEPEGVARGRFVAAERAA